MAKRIPALRHDDFTHEGTGPTIEEALEEARNKRADYLEDFRDHLIQTHPDLAGDCDIFFQVTFNSAGHPTYRVTLRG